MPPEGTAVVGVKERVMGTDDLPTIRSKDAMVKDTDATREKMLPDETLLVGCVGLGMVSTLVITLMAPVALGSVAGPSLRPTKVMVKEALPATAPPAIVITMQEHVLLLLLLFAAIPNISGNGSDCAVVKKMEG